MDSKVVSRWIPGLTLLGAVLMIAASLMHPITIDPRNAELPIRFISNNKMHWMFDHALMAAAVVLWLGGLAVCYRSHNRHLTLSPIVSALFIASLAIWLMTLAFELGSMPVSVAGLQAHPDEAQQTLSESLFAGALISGYFAMIPAWLGVVFGAGSGAGRINGMIGIAGIIYTLIDPILWILLLTTAFPFVWTVRYAWQCLRTTG